MSYEAAFTKKNLDGYLRELGKNEQPKDILVDFGKANPG